MAEPNIVLTGFMATGKTTVGKLLARHLGYDFIDTDEVIVRRAGMPVADIFQQKGEQTFRKMESALAAELSQKEGLVISTGGGMMLNPSNASALSSTGQIFCLVATPEEIFERVSRDTEAKRPLLESPDPMKQVTQLMAQREETYEKFSQMRTSSKTPDEITSNLIGIIRANPDLRLSVTASDSHYDYIVGGGILPFVRQLAGINGPMVVITDNHVGEKYADSLGPADAVISVDPGQQNKTLSTVAYICQEMVHQGCDRTTTIIALGGSVVSGLAGFAASVYMRGVDLVQCPTNLLAMADTSIGGKAGINLAQGKNLIGAFKQPKAVIADIATLQSLSSEEFSFGMAEVIKHGVIGGKHLFDQIKSGDWKWGEGSFPPSSFTRLQDLVAQAIQVKIGIVQKDPFQRDQRAVLNLGHTFAHAMEQASNHELRHGEAVSIGLVASANLSHRLGHCAKGLEAELASVLAGAGLPVSLPATLDSRKIMTAIHRDKKRKEKRPRFILMRDIGDVFMAENIPDQEVAATLEDIKIQG